MRQLYKYSDLDYQMQACEDGSSEFDALLENRHYNAFSEQALDSNSEHCEPQYKSSDDSFRGTPCNLQRKRATTERKIQARRAFNLLPNDYRIDWNTTNRLNYQPGEPHRDHWNGGQYTYIQRVERSVREESSEDAKLKELIAEEERGQQQNPSSNEEDFYESSLAGRKPKHDQDTHNSSFISKTYTIIAFQLFMTFCVAVAFYLRLHHKLPGKLHD